MLCDSLTMSTTSSLFPSELRFTAISTKINKNYNRSGIGSAMAAPVLCCSNSTASTQPISKTVPPLVIKQKKRYRKLYPGEAEGVSEEMRFVAMRFRNVKGKYVHKSGNSSDEDEQDSMNDQNPSNKQVMEEEGDDEAETWLPTIEGFIKYLVDSKLVFDTIERVVDESSDVSYAYFRKTGLERSECLSKDLDWFSRQNIVIPDPSTAGVSYVEYLEGLAEKSAPLFLCHLYNIYFSHIAGGQSITRQVSEKILEGRELEFCKWEGDVQESLKDVREKLNMLGEVDVRDGLHWTRDEKNKCLKETTKAFRFMGQIVRLIIL